MASYLLQLGFLILKNYNARRFPNLMYQNREIHTKRKKRDKLRKRKIGICGELVCNFFFFNKKIRDQTKLALKNGLKFTTWFS